MFKKAIHIFLSLCTCAVILSGCKAGISECKPWVELPCCIEGRRPPIIVSEFDDIYDFDEGALTCDQVRPPIISQGVPLHRDLPELNMNMDQEYRFSCGDILEICVADDQDTLFDNVVVAPDGKIYYLFCNGIQAQGLTANELQKSIEGQLNTFYNSPTVCVIPKTVCNQNFVVLGRVMKPGVYPCNFPIKLRDAIGQAGGVYVESVNQISLQARGSYLQGNSTSTRTPSKISTAFLLRNGHRFDIDFDKLVYHGDENQNVLVQPGDYIHVATAESAQIYILGAVRSPRSLPYIEGSTLMSALTAAGGWGYGSPYGADMNRVLIIRGSLDCPTVIWVDLMKLMRGEARDVYLCPGDIVYCQNKSFRFARELVRCAIDCFVQSFAFEAAQDLTNDIFPPIDCGGTNGSSGNCSGGNCNGNCSNTNCSGCNQTNGN